VDLGRLEVLFNHEKNRGCFMGSKYDISKIPDSYRSDIRKAVKGIPPGSFFKVYAKLMMQLNHPLDLINLEKDNRFGTMLQKEGYLHLSGVFQLLPKS
jgi:hypothetical protein